MRESACVVTSWIFDQDLNLNNSSLSSSRQALILLPAHECAFSWKENGVAAVRALRAAAPSGLRLRSSGAVEVSALNAGSTSGVDPGFATLPVSRDFLFTLGPIMNRCSG